MMRKAGNVMRLKTPNTAIDANIAVAKAEDRCYETIRLVPMHLRGRTHLGFHDPVYQNQAPGQRQRLDGIREGMCLVCPGHV